MLLQLPDTPLRAIHSHNLAPYYSLTQQQTFGHRLAELVSALLKADADNETAATVVSNIETWADRIFDTEKKLLLLAIEKRSHFTFDMIHWIEHVVIQLLAASEAPAASPHVKAELQKHASWLMFVLSWIPDDKDVISFVEHFEMTDVIFRISMFALTHDVGDLFGDARQLLVSWAFKAGKYQTGWDTFEKSLYALAVLAIWESNPERVTWLKDELTKALSGGHAPKQSERDEAARELRRRALGRRGHWSSPIHQAMDRADTQKLRDILNEIATLLSPGTASEPVRIDWR
jgi:hypothetical protein